MKTWVPLDKILTGDASGEVKVALAHQVLGQLEQVTFKEVMLGDVCMALPFIRLNDATRLNEWLLARATAPYEKEWRVELSGRLAELDSGCPEAVWRLLEPPF